MLKALEDLKEQLKNRQPLIDTLLNKTHPAKVKPKELQFYNQNLDKYQKEAVMFTVAAPVVSLIHGPPGKSSFIMIYCTFTLRL
jgi:hypothetical protein